ncbi:hypothetical protein G6F59_016394 [Rhizopus arrhizus]|nr:hypothetical protein G6F59_016394 [Rhizopus arrhizus]
MDRAAAGPVPCAVSGDPPGHAHGQREAGPDCRRSGSCTARRCPARLQPGRAQARQPAHAGVRQPGLHRTLWRAAASGRAAVPPHPGDAQAVPHRQLAALHLAAGRERWRTA